MATPKENAAAGERLCKLERKGFFDWLKKQHDIDRAKYPTNIFEIVGFERVNELMSEFEASLMGCTCSMADPLKCEACQQ